MTRVRVAARACSTLLGVLGATLLAAPASAHVGALKSVANSGSVPFWYVALVGGGIVGASFLFTSLLTDHEAIRAINGWRPSLSLPTPARSVWETVLGGAGIVVLVGVVVEGLFGATGPLTSFAVVVVWVGWWAGYTMSVYLIGNTWSTLNPWRTLAAPLSRLDHCVYPERLGAWPSVLGLLALVWIEVTSPLGQDPWLLAAGIVGYTAVTLTGVALFGSGPWFEHVDPVARVFRWYGRVAPFSRADGGVEFRVPGSELTRGLTLDRSEVAFVVALLWVTTFDGLVTTPAWNAVAGGVIDLGVPLALVYAAALLGGYGLFLVVYRLAARRVRRISDSYLTTEFVERWFVPSLLPIAAGYHIAHFLGYFLALSPALAGIVLNPLDPPANPLVVVLPGWFGALELVFILLGHMLAVWISHAIALDLFPGRLRAIRSQYPFILVMVFYTMTSMWIVSQPFVTPVGL